MSAVEGFFLKRSLLGGRDDCGDTGVIMRHGDQYFAGLVDVLGHGPEAFEVAEMAREYLEENSSEDLGDLLSGLHEHLKGTRGAVCALCRVDETDGRMTYAGAGNITLRLLGTQSLRFVLRDGVVGYTMQSPVVKSAALHCGDVVLMHSDGIREHFMEYDCPGLLSGRAEDVARSVMDCFGKETDDASCIVLRYGHD